MPNMERVASLDDLADGGALAVKVNGHAVALFRQGERISAIDNRCPHMGYPLVEAPVRDGILRCPWHHWRFELRSGGCLTSGGDDVGTFAVEVRGNEIWVADEPHAADLEARRERARRDLRQAMKETNTFLLAKAICALRHAEMADRAIIEVAVEHGLRFRDSGFGPGLVILTCLLNLGDRLPEDDQLLALVHGITHVARDSANQSPRREIRPLPPREPIPFGELTRHFRSMCDDREAAGAERLLLTALAQGADRAEVAEMLLLAATDHFFLSGGHVLDFLNKGFELLDHVGPDREAAILGSLVGPIARGLRHEETADWQEMVAPLGDAVAALDERPAPDPDWSDGGELERILLEEEPPPIIAALREAIAAGAPPTILAQVLCRAAVQRVARFHLQNENDWDDVLHLVSYCHALERLAARFAGPPRLDFALYRGIYHGAMYCHLTRFLNIPAVPLPSERRRRAELPEEAERLQAMLLDAIEYQQVETAADIVDKYLADRRDVGSLQATMVKGLLREDSVFHTFQMVECGIRRHDLLAGADAVTALVAAARYLTAQKLRRNVLWSTKNAIKLARGEGLNT